MMFYLIAIIGILYLFSKRGSASTTVLTTADTGNVVTSPIVGAAIYMPTANGVMGRVVPGPTGPFGTLGVAQTRILVAVAPVPNPASVVYEPSDAIEFATVKTIAGSTAPDMQPSVRSSDYNLAQFIP